MLKKSFLTISLLLAGLGLSCATGSPASSQSSLNNEIEAPVPHFGTGNPTPPHRFIFPAKALTADFPPPIGERLGNCRSEKKGTIRDCHGIPYQGGPVMSAPINVYLIWYGDWKDAEARRIVEEFVANLGGSDYWKINEAYCDLSGQCTTDTINLAGTVIKADYLHRELSQDDITLIVQRAINDSTFPIDVNGSYLVITDIGIPVAGTCTDFCGWHDDTPIQGLPIKYGFIANVASCPDSCTAFSNNTSNFLPPNGSIAGDGMNNIIAHELDETATDPNLDAWVDGFYENGDHCSWQFPKTYLLPNGGTANINVRGQDYLVQGNWVLKDAGFCDVSP